MNVTDPDRLRELSKNEQAFRALKEMVGGLQQERDQFRNRLQLLEAAVQGDYDSILITGLELEHPGPRIVYVNDGFCRMTGYSREEVIGKTPRILQGPKTDRAVLDRLKKRLEKGKAFFGQTVNYRKDGSEFVNQWDIHPLTDRDGHITHWVSYQHDITERKRAEKVLVDAKMEFDGLREESQRTVVDVDAAGRIVMANKSFRELTGYGREELKQRKVWELFPRKFRDSLKDRFDRAGEEQVFDNREFKGIIKHKSGFPIQIAGSTRLLRLRDRNLIRTEIKNISLQKRVLSTLDQRNRDFSRLVDRASEFSYRVRFEGEVPSLEMVSEAFPEISGLSADVVVGNDSFERFVHPDDLSKLREHLETVRGGRQSTCGYRLRTRDGSYAEAMDFCRPLWDEKDEQQVKGAYGAVSVDPAYNRVEKT